MVKALPRLSNMLGGGVIVQRFGDLGERKTKHWPPEYAGGTL